MELDKFTTEDIETIINEFICTTKENGYKVHVNNDKNLGYGGFCNINDNYVIKLHIFPYPTLIVVELIQKYESFIMDGKIITSYQWRGSENNTNIKTFINDSINKLIKEIK